ncbi:MAG: Crp/Fnr family transcriptional regulator [Bacteroidaceae bacterium]|jgi:CRP-like cAMP-binding protein
MNNSTYDLLRLMPLLQGISFDDFTRILEKCPFDFRKVTSGATIVRQGDACQELLYLIRGTFSATTELERFTMEEEVVGPALIEPYSLMGYDGCYTSTYRAEVDSSYFALRKNEVLERLCSYPIVRMNLLNILSRRAQVLRQRLLRPVGATAEEKVKYWLLRVCNTYEGRKAFRIRMEDLADEVNETRLSVSRVLNAWKDRDLASISRGKLQILAAERLGLDLLKR